MMNRKLDVTTGSPHPSVRRMRTEFNQHVDQCTDCQPSMCWSAQIKWRTLCLEALKLHASTPVAIVPLHQRAGL